MSKLRIAAAPILILLAGCQGNVRDEDDIVLSRHVAATRSATGALVSPIRIQVARGPAVAFESSQVMLASAVEVLKVYVDQPRLRQEADDICSDELPRLVEMAGDAKAKGVVLLERLTQAVDQLKAACEVVRPRR